MPMRADERNLLIYIVAVSVFVTAMLTIAIVSAHSRDSGQWESTPPEIRAWFQSLKQPDNGVSCCGEADSYYCSEHADSSGQIYCIMDDERDNEALRRTPVPNGTRINIPPEKLNHDPNMTGRAIVFLSGGGYVYCFISAGGS